MSMDLRRLGSVPTMDALPTTQLTEDMERSAMRPAASIATTLHDSDPPSSNYMTSDQKQDKWLEYVLSDPKGYAGFCELIQSERALVGDYINETGTEAESQSSGLMSSNTRFPTPGPSSFKQGPSALPDTRSAYLSDPKFDFAGPTRHLRDPRRLKTPAPSLMSHDMKSHPNVADPIASSSSLTAAAPRSRRPKSLFPSPLTSTHALTPSLYTPAIYPSSAASSFQLTTSALPTVGTLDLEPTIVCPLPDCREEFANTLEDTVAHVYQMCRSAKLAHTRPQTSSQSGIIMSSFPDIRAKCQIECPAPKGVHSVVQTRYKNLRSWAEHLITMHGKRNRPVFCPECQAAFSSIEKWQAHRTARAARKCAFCKQTMSCQVLLDYEKACLEMPGSAP
ncbi:hypothetical protein DFH11DRAFT_843998 [Phellopilus nigrolimitatus]|nr:hypothetical protein DFH11DRAFT_843998 [Phellopilus nigrolimitatus]